MKFHRITAAFLAALHLCACSPVSDEDPANTASVTVINTAETSAEQEAPITVSPLADEDFLLPIEDFSWEREFDPEFIMIHFTSAVMVDYDDPYNMDKIRQIFIDGGVSINYIIDRDGTVRCYIPEDHAAWHAGKGKFSGNEKYTDKMNKYSIGIELVAIGSETDMAQYMDSQEYHRLKSPVGFTDAQYESLEALVKDICERNDIPLDRSHVIGHSEYSPTKSDPGTLFEWERIVR